MIFIRYESFRGYVRSYPVTVALIALNLIYFIVLVLNGNPNSAPFAYRFGAFFTEPGVDSFGLDQPWRYVTSQFMHASLEHLLYNMFALLIFAPPLEYLLKSKRYLPFFIACGIGGNLLSALMAIVSNKEFHIAVGASGAIYGVYGAFLFIALYRKTMIDSASRRTIYIILAFGVVHSLLVKQIDLWGHVGGALTGLLIYSLLDRSSMWKQRYRQ